MLQTTLNTTPLFQTSLRDWQANWKASRGQDRSGAGSGNRIGKLSRRSPKPGGNRPRA
jgi:hypothetical protein